ncbi:MAG TPA: glycoside hydrolase family 9 protein [Gemmatimonadaceae bacterium]|nr:glycoside hydrolase family 9 protein [Gemmatimonadaceae bacterium]
MPVLMSTGRRRARLALVLAAVAAAPAAAQPHRPMLPIDFERSAEFGWLGKPVRASRTLDDMADSARWRLTGTGRLTFPAAARPGGMRVLRVDMQLFRGAPAPTRNRFSSVNLRRAVANEDWSGYNRLSMWVRPDFSGIPVLPLQVVLHNEGAERVPDRYDREGTHYVTLARNEWQQVVWEIEPLARDRVTLIEIGYFVNKMLTDPGDRVAFEIGRIELQRVDPDHHTGWTVAPGRVSFSHTGYQAGYSKTALAGDTAAAEFQLLRVSDNALGEVVARGPVRRVRTPLGEFGEMDFSDVDAPGRYVLRVGDERTRPFRIGPDVWDGTIWKTLNFFYGNRCGYDVPGVHGIDHLDWFATHGDQRISLSGGWHDAGDLSQGVINTGEGTYAMFALAERLAARGSDPALVERLIEEARWGLDWVLRVRFDGGYRVGFASLNYWTNNVAGDADDKVVEAKDNPNANYIAAAAGAIAARVLRDRDPALAERSLRTAEDDWAHAVVGVEGPSTWHTPAFAASRMELAGIGITASVELFRATGKRQYADKAVELARVVTASQQTRRVGSAFPLAGFFYTGPDRDTLFHQFHRAADQAPVVALAQLVETFPDHPEWMRWYAAVARYAEYQKRSASATAPYGVLPAYVYRLADTITVPDSGGRYMATRAAYGAQVRAGLSMGEGWYLRAFPVWFQRRGNYGVLLSQAKALSAASRLRGDRAGLDLAQRQAQWVVGRNPFAQSTMYGEGYDWAQQYSVSSADFVGSLPVGMQSRGVTDLPYWPSQNMYVYKEVWVHPSARWLWLMADLLDGAPPPPADSALSATATTAANGEVTIRLTTSGEGVHTYELRADELTVDRPSRTVTLRAGRPATIEWKARPASKDAAWVAVVIPDGDVSRRREVAQR